MNIVRYPKRAEWEALLARPEKNVDNLREVVAGVLSDIRQNGDDAVKKYEEKFDKVSLSTLAVSPSEFEEAQKNISPKLLDAIKLAHENIKKFHAAQKFETIKVETAPGVTCWQKSVAIPKVGLYIPGGTAPLFSTVLMLAAPAKIAGCSEIVLCTPPDKEGKVNPAILCAAKIAGVCKIYKIGGVQAIGAMAYGTESVPKVYKIFGPGNQYVMAAKQMVSLADVAIDMPAGPSEVEVLADETSNPEFIAADLLSQAEHGVDSQVVMITTSEEIIGKVQTELEKQLEALERKDIAQKALDNSKIILVEDEATAVEMTNEYAPEHLILANKNYREVAEQIVSAGSVFMGQYSCESAGDYASGTNHTLPTKGYAKAYSGLSLDSFVRKMTFQELSAEGIKNIGPAVEEMAKNEQLGAHANAMTVRLKSLNK